MALNFRFSRPRNAIFGINAAAFKGPSERRFWPALRHWMRHIWPIFTAAILSLGVWDMITAGLDLLPLPYFPGPAAVLRSLISDRALLLDSTWHSLVLLLSGYTLGVIIGLVSGVCIGWSSSVRYWGCRC